jgi:hypothetical protein
MAIATAAFARNRADDIFFTMMAWLILAVVVAGFGHAYFFAGMVAAKLASPLVHVHAAILTGWIALQAVQPMLVSADRVDWHQKLGTLGMALAACVPVIGVLAVIGEIRRLVGEPLEGDLAFVAVAAIDFAVLAALGLRERRHDLSAHKRLMLLATVSILGPPIGRLAFAASDAGYYGTFAVFLALPVMFDLVTRRRLHRATLWGVALIAASQALAEFASRTEAAHQMVAWIRAL